LETSSSRLPEQLGFNKEIQRLKSYIADWISSSHREIKPPLYWQLNSGSKYFRPVTIFACHLAVTGKRPSEHIIRSAAALELIHNVSLIVDDILDRSRYRRSKLTLHCKFGLLPGLMTSGYITAGAMRMVSNDEYAITLLGELLQRLGVAECTQWRLRRQPLGIEDWRAIAAEDTGSMFEICARLGTQDEKLGSYGRLLGILYHGCDDVADMRGAKALGGGGDEDLRDGILTLPIAIAIRDPKVALMHRDPNQMSLKILVRKASEALDAAEEYLDGIAAEAEKELCSVAAYPNVAQALITHTRALSK